MSKKSKVGKCALCEKVNIELQNSHIIPKLVYRRMNSDIPSKFTVLNNPFRVWQNGVHSELLCSGGEAFFSMFEDYFVKNILEEKITGEINIQLLSPKIKNYVISVSWRVL